MMYLEDNNPLHFDRMPINIKALCAAPPEALAHSPSQMPLSCPVAPPSQREMHKDGGGGGGGVAMSPEAQVLPHVLWHALRTALRSCAVSLACSSFTCRLGKAWGAVEQDECHDEHLCASVLRATGGLVLPMRGSSTARDKAEDHKSERAFTRELQFWIRF